MNIILGVIMLGVCHQHLAKLHGNVPLRKNVNLYSNYLVSTSQQIAINFCAIKCVMYSECMSFSFDHLRKTCELYSEDSTTAGSGLIAANSAVFIDVKDWPQGKASVCSHKPCAGDYKQCVPDGQSFHCGKWVNCQPYNLPENGAAEGGLTIVPVGQYLRVGCQLPYVSAGMASWYSKCFNDGTWPSSTHQCYTVAELCRHPILENVNISVRHNGGDLVAADILFTSSTGVTVGSSYLEIKFLGDFYENWIGGVSTKGGKGNQWVTSYRIQYTKNCTDIDYKYIRTPLTNETRVFAGNVDVNTTVQHTFDEPINVFCLRIYPIEYQHAATMRVELLRCN